MLHYPGSRTESPNQNKWRRAEADEEAAVAKNVEAFRAGKIATDAKALHLLCAPELSYGHADGHVEHKPTFIANATSRRSKFLSLTYDDVKFRVVGTAATVSLGG